MLAEEDTFIIINLNALITLIMIFGRTQQTLVRVSDLNYHGKVGAYRCLSKQILPVGHNFGNVIFAEVVEAASKRTLRQGEFSLEGDLLCPPSVQHSLETLHMELMSALNFN